jgi:hypothetical protein
MNTTCSKSLFPNPSLQSTEYLALKFGDSFYKQTKPGNPAATLSSFYFDNSAQAIKSITPANTGTNPRVAPKTTGFGVGNTLHMGYRMPYRFPSNLFT